MADLVQYYGTRRRKSSIARVFLRPGSGNFSVNGRAFDNYFVTEAQRVSAANLAGNRQCLQRGGAQVPIEHPDAAVADHIQGPGTGKAATGRPQASASSKASPKVSVRLGMTKTSAEA